jgi:two-component system, chemotaxis family, sensor kinase CheA
VDLEDIKQTFITESSEILQRMEAILLEMELGKTDTEYIHELFRGFHTIKGSAGIFGYDTVVEFTHAVESVMERVRNSELEMSRELISVLLESRDHITELIESIANNLSLSPSNEKTQEQLLKNLSKFLSGSGVNSVETPEILPSTVVSKQQVSEVKITPDKTNTTETALPEVASTPQPEETEGELWHISIRFHPSTFVNGLEPISILRYLSEYGTIVNVVTLTQSVPVLDDLDPEHCFLGFEINLRYNGTVSLLESCFDFIRDDSHLFILSNIDRSREIFLDLLLSIARYDKKPILLFKTLIFMGVVSRKQFQTISKKRIIHQTKKTESEIVSTDQSIHRSHPENLPTVSEPKEGPVKQESIIDRKNVNTKHIDNQTIRVDARKLDQLINTVGELVIAGATIKQISSKLHEVQLEEASDRLSHLIGEIRESALKIRMVPIGDTFNRFQRTVRDIGMELGKEIHLEILGGDTELDKTVVEKLNDPLMHIIRNAIDHGIENGEERVLADKPSHGSLLLNAYHENGFIIIEVKDDGRGINKEKVRLKAVERNLIGESTVLSDEDIINLIFRPGFSTADQITNLSGRGVGLDVVKKNIESLRGSISIQSEKGKGSTFRVRLPLTLAIIDGFLVSIGNSFFVLPLDVVVECIEFKEEYITSKNIDSINLRGESLPFIRLAELFDLGTSQTKRKNIIIIRFAGKQAGILVDDLHGEIQTVIKPLGKVFQHLKSISGSSIMGNGEIALILDIPSLVQNISESVSYNKVNRRSK